MLMASNFSRPFQNHLTQPEPDEFESHKEEEEDDSQESEWGGINDSSDISEGSEDDSTFDENDDEFVAGSSTSNAGYSTTTAPSVVVFADPTKKDVRSDISQKKSFMSSKISKLSQNAQPQKTKTITEDDEEERTNLQNDALLHKLVHTKLLSGSLNPELDLTPAQRRKALSGRIMELTGDARLGRGEKSVKEAERNKHSKRVREGLVAKEKERQKARLEEAKNLGTYHPSLKKLFDSDSEPKVKKRQRGLQMGVGKFRSGVLQLSRHEIGSIHGHTGTSKSSRGRKRR
ncbi:hypothetical protein K435DRAFT_772087 [Dendrothele bispora CBS 962.96]|uniref:Uncharacterized protein n=1 Tax=Dendrothele bispora (strain CBS 962.96) TaxID=1314807 RepID=A0A4S8MZK9_DENBC|nr:hypothetical protein K435DRAFT_772087 [Dendrothele bispora CBS 962.96]